MTSTFTSLRDLFRLGPKQKIAFCFAQGERKATLTYGEALSRIEAFPLPEETTVGLFLDQEIDILIALFALIGKRRLVLLNPEDQPETIIAEMQATRVEKLYGSADLCEEFAPYLHEKQNIEETEVLFFTSGTTSLAKAVMLTESSLLAAARNGSSLLPLKQEDVLLSMLPLSHVFGFVCALLWPLYCGASVALYRGRRMMFFDFAFFQPTATTLVPQMAGFFLAKGLYNPELKLILIGAGDCPDAVLQGIAKLGIRVSFGYGLTETSSGIALSLGDEPRAFTICPDYDLRIAEDGEILVHSKTTLMKGYFEDDKATKAVLKGDVLYTGDLGYLDEHGRLHLCGRKKDTLVFSDGTKLYLPEYEAKLVTYLGEEADFAIGLDAKGRLTLVIFGPRDYKDEAMAFNATQSRNRQIVKIVRLTRKPDRTKTGKIQRYKLPLDEEGELL